VIENVCDRNKAVSMKPPTWVNKATFLDSVTVEVGFCISDSFYYGPENRMTDREWQEMREALYQPKIKQREGLVVTSAVQYHVEELFRYYQNVLSLSEKHNRLISQDYFWMRPIIYSPERTIMTFPWYDTWTEAENFLQQVSTDKCGPIFSDIEQGWKADIYATADKLFFQQDNNLSTGCHRQNFHKQLPSLRERAQKILNELQSHLGKDYWSKHWRNL
jgi:hypothetical protein